MMSTTNELFDVAVLGGGPAGITSALAAARSGAKTILIERYGFLGGMSTAALVYPWMTFHTAAGDQVIRGIAQEIVERLMAMGASPGHLRDTIGFVHTVTPYDGEKYKLLAFEMLKEAGVTLMLHSFITGADAEDGRIRSVTIHNKSGVASIQARCYVDATGDGDVAYYAGAPWEMGNEEQKVQPMTMKFRLKGVRHDAIKQYMQSHPEQFYKKSLIDQLDELPITGVMGYYDLWRKAALPIARDGVLMFAGPGEDEVLVNISRISGLDPTNTAHLTEAEVEGRKQVYQLEDFFQTYIPGFENAYVSQVAPQIGVRETRRVIGEYILTGIDVLSARKFHDCIARSGYPIDIHDPKGAGVTANFIAEGGAYDIPYRSIVPKGMVNLWLAGRCISTSHEAQATARLTPSCMALGQAAGTAAALAAKHDYSASDLSIEQLQQSLLDAGAELGK